MRDLIVHEWIEKSGGSEVVLDAIVDALPGADILSLWKDDEERYAGRNLRESWIARTPLRRSKILALPVMPTTWARTDTSGYDRALVSSHLFAHQVGGSSPQRRADRTYVYVHTPARYVWTPELDKRGSNPLVRAAAAVLKPYDRRAARHATALAANSEFVRTRIANTWDRDSIVIYPPVNVARIAAHSDWRSQLGGEDLRVFESLPADFVFGASRFVPYKELDVVIATGEAAGLPVVLAGDGPERQNLEALAATATVPVIFVGRPSDALLYALYQAATVYVFPAVEDFGIMPVEAMAAGARVLVGSTGGATESVIDGLTGMHVESWSGAALGEAVSRASLLDAGDAVKRAWDFDASHFRENYLSWIDQP
ncbi:glycosyltransferase [Subtercola boreus]|uniref:D-inositol 3-phosphate glycosyltransferase n=1 Tax=Subtercola boreus TaxID=120213 RepID=A0A3E0W718_9MICO|nr:glycosyltransferase [Subtercola boreus]RFA18747.1 glycosyl transferase [Subtercola boreus]RFA18864.1 glycosyl transferase [Subtercola boreus]RFA25399.1 glycosyl transferase [Subtercola boreus]